MENHLVNTKAIREDELLNLYRTTKSSFLQLHRLLIRHGMIHAKERMVIFDLTSEKISVKE